MTYLKNFTKEIGKVVRKTYKPVSKNFYVTVKSEGIKNRANKGSYYIVDGNNMLLTGIVMFNALNNEPSTSIYDSWNPICNLRLKGKAGFGILVQSRDTGYSEIFPIDAKTVREFKAFKGIAGVQERYHGDYSNVFWAKRFEDCFDPSDLEDLIELYNEKAKAYGATIKVYKKDPRDNYDPETWVKRGYPCAYRYGYAYRGAKANRIPNDEAMKKLGHVFESNYEQIGGIWHLVLQDYSANDMW